LLSSALASGALARLVGYFAVRPDDAPHIRALMRNTGLTARSLQIELARLQRLGLVVREVATDGRVHIRAISGGAAWAPFRHLVRTYADPTELLRFALADVPGIAAAFVFGSVARGSPRSESDLDLFVLAEPALEGNSHILERVLAQRTVEASLSIGREVNPMVLTACQLAAKVGDRSSVYENLVAGPKRWVFGSGASLRDVRRVMRSKVTKALA